MAITSATSSSSIQSAALTLPPVDPVVQIRDGQMIFVKPKVLLGEVEPPNEGIELNFIEVEIDGSLEVIPVQRPAGQPSYSGQEYTSYPGSLEEALFKMARDCKYRTSWSTDGRHFGSPIGHILKRPHCKVTVESFLTFLNTPTAEGLLPIFSINKKSLEEVLELSRYHSIPLQLVCPKTGETLIGKWVGREAVKIVQALLFHQCPVKPAYLSEALIYGGAEEIELLNTALQQQASLEMSIEDQWLMRAFRDEVDFSEQEFSALDPELQTKLARVANTHVSRNFLQKLREVGWQKQPTTPEKAAILSSDMDALHVEEAFRQFLVDLRQKGCLLTKEEFAQLPAGNYKGKWNGAAIGRILGRDYIAKTAERLQLKHIKVPKKIAVIESSAPSIAFTVNQYSCLPIHSEQLSIWAEKIKPLQEFVNREEMLELLDLVEETGYNDCGGDNICLATNQAGERGVYFIDTEYMNFYNGFHPFRGYGGIPSLGGLMAPADHQWFNEQVKGRFEAYNKKKAEEQEEVLQAAKQRNQALLAHGFGDRTKPFVFPIAEILS